MQALLIAIQFLTRIPVARNLQWQEHSVAQSVLYYPLVGLVIGVIVWLCSLFEVQAMLMSALLLLVWVLLTGGLHIDGLADSVDAWAGGLGDREKTLQIMKDPAAGPMAVVAIALVLLLKFAALYVLLQQASMFWFLMVPILGRMAVLVLFLTTPYVRAEGLGSAMAEHFNHTAANLVLLMSVIALLILFPFVQVVLCLLASALMLFVLRALMMQRIQGMTGDTLGASIELVETSCILVLALSVSVA